MELWKPFFSYLKWYVPSLSWSSNYRWLTLFSYFWIPLAARRHQNPHAAPIHHYIEARTVVIGPYPVLIYAIRKLEAALMAPIIFPLDPLICQCHEPFHTAMTSCDNVFPSTRGTLSSNVRTRLSSLREKKKIEEEERLRKTTRVNMN